MLALASLTVSSFEVERLVDKSERRGGFLMDDLLDEVAEEVVEIECPVGFLVSQERLSVKWDTSAFSPSTIWFPRLGNCLKAK
jgi:hypothetical protein